MQKLEDKIHVAEDAKNKTAVLFSLEALVFTNETLKSHELNDYCNSTESLITLIPLGFSDPETTLEAYADNYMDVVVVLEDITEGPIAKAAKDRNYEILPADAMCKTIKGYNCTII